MFNGANAINQPSFAPDAGWGLAHGSTVGPKGTFRAYRSGVPD
jgi:hypothetical protein